MKQLLWLEQILAGSYRRCIFVCGIALLISQAAVLSLRDENSSAAVGLSLLTGLVLLGVMAATFMRFQRRALQQMQNPVVAAEPPLQRVRALLAKLSAQAGMSPPAVVLAPATALRSVGGAAVSFAPGQPLLLRVSLSLASGEECRLRAVLAHELGHVADRRRCGRYAAISIAAAVLLGLPVYGLTALARPELLELPSLAAVLLIYLPLSLLLNGSRELQADRFMMALDERHAAGMLDHLATCERPTLWLSALHPRLRVLRRAAA